MTPDQGWLATGTMHFQRARECVLDVARQIGGAEPATDVLTDLSRFGNDGAMTDVTWTQLASGLWVMNFNGTSSIVTIADAASQHFGNNSFAVEFWIKLLTNYNGDFIGKYDWGNADIWGFSFTSATNIRLYHEALTTNIAISNCADAWNHFVLLFNRVDDKVYPYQQGSVGTGVAFASQGFSPLINLTIGDYVGEQWAECPCQTAMIRIYNFAPASQTILNHYNYEKALFGL